HRLRHVPRAQPGPVLLGDGAPLGPYRPRLRLADHSWPAHRQPARRRRGAPRQRRVRSSRAARHGGYWLLATEHFADYGPEQAARVQRILAPALSAGLPRPDAAGEAPHLLALTDAH